MPPSPNTFITPSIIAKVGLATLYDNLVFAGLVSRDYDSDFTGKQGDTITIRKPAIFQANTYDRTAGIVVQDAVEHSMPVVLDTLVDVSFAVTSEDLLLNISDFSQQLLQPAMMALVLRVDRDLANAIAGAATGTGGGGTVSQGSADAASVFIGAREKLTRAKLPLQARTAVLSPEAVSSALSDDLFVQAQQAGSTSALREADVGRTFGIDNYESGVLGSGPGAAGTSDGLAFHQTAVTFVSRALPAPAGVATEMVAIESFRNLTLRTVYQYSLDKKQDVVSIDILYGIAATRPQGAVVLNFGKGS
jgi:hypothetical protein